VVVKTLGGIEMDKVAIAYKRLGYVFYVYVASLTVPFLGVELTGGQSVLWGGVFLVSHVAYLYLLGAVVLGAKRSLVRWVGLTFITGPLGTVVSYFFLKPVAIEQGWN
jgi:hypothetical protein